MAGSDERIVNSNRIIMSRLRRIRYAASAMGVGLLILAHTAFAPSINTPRHPQPRDSPDTSAILNTRHVYTDYDEDSAGSIPTTSLTMTMTSSTMAGPAAMADEPVWPSYYYWGAAYIIIIVIFNLVAEVWYEFEIGRHLISRLWYDLWSGRLFVWLYSALPVARQPLDELDPNAAAAAAVVRADAIPTRRRRRFTFQAVLNPDHQQQQEQEQQQRRSVHGNRWWGWWRGFGPQIVVGLRTWSNNRRNRRPAALEPIDNAPPAAVANEAPPPVELEMEELELPMQPIQYGYVVD